MFSKKDFQDWGKSDVVLFASVTTQIQGRKNDNLLGKYGFDGFPSFAILDANGRAVTKRVGRDLASMQSAVQSATACVRLEAKQAAGEQVDESELVLAQLGLGRIELADAKEKLLPLKLSTDRRKEVAARLFEIELGELRGLANRNMDRAGQRVLALFHSGQRPQTGSKLMGFYDELLLRGAEVEQDGKAYLDVYPRMRKKIITEISALKKQLTGTKDADQKRSQADRCENLKKDLDYMDERAAAFREAQAAAEAEAKAEAAAEAAKKKKRVVR